MFAAIYSLTTRTFALLFAALRSDRPEGRVLFGRGDREVAMKGDEAPDYAAWSFYVSLVEVALDLLARLLG
ncbi:hypothetical protein [Streptomyces sp. SID8016]|uniref:hypothetical protein n=1 Tax=Streptomyces sp. SID8016 TaxID=2706098 RepID=UPI0013D93636|nr:hypothetical protein [Streptomyces sp. SID8016]